MNPQHLKTMLSLQSQMNAAVEPKWLEAGFPYLRAVVVEGGEGMEHHGWKWWKLQTMDVEQLRLELVDILHFYLSAAMVEANAEMFWGDGDDLYDRTSNAMLSNYERECAPGAVLKFDEAVHVFSDLKPLDRLELMIGLAVSRRISLRLLLDAWVDTGASTEDLFLSYVGKNMLNMFRQQNGYKEGTYLKDWSGREDNEHLSEILDAIDLNADNIGEDIMDALKDRYDLARWAIQKEASHV